MATSNSILLSHKMGLYFFESSSTTLNEKVFKVSRISNNHIFSNSYSFRMVYTQLKKSVTSLVIVKYEITLEPHESGPWDQQASYMFRVAK